MVFLTSRWNVFVFVGFLPTSSKTMTVRGLPVSLLTARVLVGRPVGIVIISVVEGGVGFRAPADVGGLRRCGCSIRF